MNNSLSKKYIKIIILAFLAVLAVSLCIGLTESRRVSKEIDEKLYWAGKNLKYYAGQGMIAKNYDDLDSRELNEVSLLLDGVIKDYELDKFYIIGEYKNKLQYLIYSRSEEEAFTKPRLPYPVTYDYLGDETYEEIEKAYNSTRVNYTTNKVGGKKYRNVYIPETTIDGTPYLIGLSVRKSAIDAAFLMGVVGYFFKTFLLFICITPILYYARKLASLNGNMVKKISTIEHLDKLTRAFNREKGLKILEERIKSYHEIDKGLTIGIFDIDNLQDINKDRGMSIGDKMLTILFNILKFVFRDGDPIARIEGNKFIVILPEISREKIIGLRKMVDDKIISFNKNNKLNYYIGVNYAFTTYHGQGIRDYLQTSLDKLRILSPSSEKEYSNFYKDVTIAFEKDEFEVYLQPKVFMLQNTIEFEALLRWKHPEKGFIPPSTFIPLMEKYNFIDKITQKIFKKSLEFAKANNVKVSINLSPNSLKTNELVDSLIYEMNFNKAHEYISLEITEDVKIEKVDKVIERIELLKNLGYRFSLDDFGAGYSSIGYLDKLPINELKLDKSLTDTLATSKVNQLTLEYVSELSKVKDFNVICEGVEEEDQVKALMSLGVFNFQGYYFGRPEPLKKIEEKLRTKYFDNMLIALKSSVTLTA